MAPLTDRWKGLITIFQPTTWIVFILIFLIAVLSWLLFGITMPEQPPHKKIIMCAMNTWSVFLGISSNNRPERTPLRIFFVLLALYGLNVTTIYTSNLINVFTHPNYEKQIDTIEDIVANDMPLGGRQEYQDWFEGNSSEMDTIVFKLYNSSVNFKPTISNFKFVENGKQAMLVNKNYILNHKLNENVFAIPRNVFSNPMEMIAKRGFPLLRTCTRLINRMKDAGLISKFYNDFVYNVTYLEKIRQRHYDDSNAHVPLSMEHLQGAFAVLFVGWTISTFVFILEIISATARCKHYVQTIKIVVSVNWTKLLIWLKLENPIEKSKISKRK